MKTLIQEFKTNAGIKSELKKKTVKQYFDTMKAYLIPKHISYMLEVVSQSTFSYKTIFM
jgi:hypothetical protein